MDMLTREIYGNIDSVSKVLFYILSAAAVACCAVGVSRHLRRWLAGEWRAGIALGRALDWARLPGRLWDRILSQTKIRHGRPGAGWLHGLLFWSFAILFVGTVLVSIEHYGAALLGRTPDNPLFHKGVYFVVFEWWLDLAGLVMVVAVVGLGIRRAAGRSSIDRRLSDWGVLGLLLGLGITGFWLEGQRIVLEQTPAPAVAPIGYFVSLAIAGSNPDPALVPWVHRWLWWIHAIFALGLIAWFPYCRLLHAIAGSAQLLGTPRSYGTMVPISMEQVEAAGFVGVDRIADLTVRQRLELDACVACGRCQDVCPAYLANKPLSPRDLVQDLRGQLDGWRPVAGSANPTDPANHGVGQQRSLCGDVVAEETLWACTTCGACEAICPLEVGPATLITDLRRFLVGEGRFRGTPAAALAKMQRSGNPWGLPAEDRFLWAKDLDVRTAAECGDFEWLYWVGCAAAYDPNSQRIARAMVRILQQANVSFAVLGAEERCTGDSARRMGDEFVFQELAATNMETLDRYRVQKIVTHCPHCLNSLRADYPRFGGQYHVVHHTEMIADLIATGRLPIGPPDTTNQIPSHSTSAPIITDGVPRSRSEQDPRRTVYHDPCYLARIQGIDQPPRFVLEKLFPQGLAGLKRSGRDTACCGGGGGRMWFDDRPEDRIGIDRFDELIATGADTIAVACPFCQIMFRDAANDQNRTLEIRDIAEIVAARLLTE